MKYMKKIAALAVLAFSFASCESFLDTTNYWSKDSSNFPVNATDAEQMLAGIYNNLNVSIGNNVPCEPLPVVRGGVRRRARRRWRE